MWSKSLQKSAKLAQEKSGEHTGILEPARARQHFRLKRYVPSREVAPFVEHYWIIRWDLHGQPPYTSEVLPYPSVNIAFFADGARITGVTTGLYRYTLQGVGVIAGIMFKPGGFYPFFGKPVVELTDHVVAAQTVFPEANQTFSDALLGLPSDAEIVDQLQTLLLRHQPTPDDHITQIHQIIDRVIHDPAIHTVRAAAQAFAVSERTLQHLFHAYVGVGLKWIIMRYRLQDAAELAARSATPQWAAIAAELGYSSQSHFANDFKKIIGKSPSQYLKSLK